MKQTVDEVGPVGLFSKTKTNWGKLMQKGSKGGRRVSSVDSMQICQWRPPRRLSARPSLVLAQNNGQRLFVFEKETHRPNPAPNFKELKGYEFSFRPALFMYSSDDHL